MSSYYFFIYIAASCKLSTCDLAVRNWIENLPAAGIVCGAIVRVADKGPLLELPIGVIVERFAVLLLLLFVFVICCYFGGGAAILVIEVGFIVEDLSDDIAVVGSVYINI